MTVGQRQSGRTLRVKTNRACCDSCASGKACEGKPLFFNSEAETGAVRRETQNGEDILVVPLVMAKADKVMNDGVFPAEAMQPQAWNGTPVTLRHPTVNGMEMSIGDSPELFEQFAIGSIFNSSVDEGKLRGEAWLNVRLLETKMPGLLEMLESDVPVDVSTGLFSNDIEQRGKMNGETYTHVYSQVIPDHLAILPDEEGACSWEDGCGVRVNRSQATGTIVERLMETIMKLRRNQLKTNSKGKPKSNERGGDDNLVQMAADLISNEESPFMPEDEDALRMMTPDTLAMMRDKFAPIANEEEEKANEEEEKSNEGDEHSNEGDEHKNEGDYEANEEEEKPMANKKQVLTNKDREALAYAHKIHSEHKSSLVEKVVANSSITKAQAEAMETATLEVVANGLNAPAPNYAGRVQANSNAVQGSDDAEAGAMFNSGVVRHFTQKKAS